MINRQPATGASGCRSVTGALPCQILVARKFCLLQPSVQIRSEAAVFSLSYIDAGVLFLPTRKNNRPIGDHPTEILHIDAVNSQIFFESFDSNNSEKCDCQRIVREEFAKSVQSNGGWVSDNWQGDGGHAFFPATGAPGASISAARDFLRKLPLIAQQTVTTLARDTTPEFARRRFRVKAHFASMFFAEDGGLDSGASEEFDSFLNHEKDLAPLPDELFITDALRKRLSGAQRDKFVQHKREETYGKLTTALYRLKTPPAKVEHLLVARDNVTGGELNFLKEQIRSQVLITAARNFITTGLMSAVAAGDGTLSSETLLNLSLQGMYNYLKADNPHQEFRISIWRASLEVSPPRTLQKVAAYPQIPDFVTRTVGAMQFEFQVARAFTACSPIVTEDVIESRLKGEWKDFDDGQADSRRCLHSAIQLPIYRTTNKIGDFIHNEVLGVMSIDCDKPRFFSIELRDLWTNNLTGFVANIALSELMQLQRIRSSTSP
jgi:hypothetical protein